MFEIVACTIAELQVKLEGFSDQIPFNLYQKLDSSNLSINQNDSPFVQLGYDEIADEEINRLLGYAGIASVNAPIGLNGDFAPVLIGTEPKTQVLLFSLPRLEQHLSTVEPDLVRQIRNLGSMDSLVDKRCDALTASEYLTGGLLACIEYCRTKDQAIIIKW